jgi:DNA repair exonuclease SbcCD ATPase subunit
MADETTEPETTETETPEGAKPESELGDAGKKALDAERAARKAAEDEQKKLAAKLKEIEDRDKSEADKAAERLAEAEKRAAEVEARATRAEIAASSSVPADILTGPESSSAEHIQAFADKVLAWAEASKKNPNGPIIPGQGKQPENKAAENADDWLRNLARA